MHGLLSWSSPYLLTPWCRVLLEKLTGLQLVKKFPAFYGTRRFITALTSVRHLFLSWANPIQSTYPYPTSWRSILILSTHLRLGLPSGLFPSGFSTKTLYAPFSSPIRATCPAHLIFLDFITRTILGEEYRSLSSKGGRSSIRNLMTRHAVVTGTHYTWGPAHTVFKIILPLYSLTVFAVFSARITADIAAGDAANESLVCWFFML